MAGEYARIRLWSAPAVLANYAILGWFLGQQNSRVTLIILVLTNAVNILLDLLFVVGFGMTSDGVAWATVIADFSALAVGLWLVSRQLRRLEGRFRRERLLRLGAYAELFQVNANLFVRTLGLLFATAFFTAQARLKATPSWPPTRCCCSSSCSLPTAWMASPTPPKP